MNKVLLVYIRVHFVEPLRSNVHGKEVMALTLARNFGGSNTILKKVWNGEYDNLFVLKRMNSFALIKLVNNLVLLSNDYHKQETELLEKDIVKPAWWPATLKFVYPVNLLQSDYPLRWHYILELLVTHCFQFRAGCNISHRVQRTLPLRKSGRNPRSVCDKNVIAARESAVEIHESVSFRAKSVDLMSVVDTKQERNCELVCKTESNSPANSSPNSKRSFLKWSNKFNVTFGGNCETSGVLHRQCCKGPNKTSPLKCKFSQHPYVRVHNLLKTHDTVECSKNEYMSYLKLQESSSRLINSVKFEKMQSKTFGTESIPISSELGQLVVRQTVDEVNVLYKLQRLEWFLKEIPSMKNKNYAVTYSKRKEIKQCDHEYSFPRRQHRQTHVSLKQYAYFRLCKPLNVHVEQLDLRLHKDLLLKYMKIL